jgi:RNA polymerase sigma-70 factor, ECF subfamily
MALVGIPYGHRLASRQGSPGGADSGSGMMTAMHGPVEREDAEDARLSAAVRAAQDGDEAAFRAVYRAVHPRLIAYVRTLVPACDAEDVVSEAWLQITRDLGRFRGGADRFRGWAARIARNRALDHLRRLDRRPLEVGDVEAACTIESPADTAGEALEALSTEQAFALIARLPEDQAEAVVLRVVMGLDTKGAARVLGKRPGAVRTCAHRGLRRLAELLAETGGLDGVPVPGAPAQEDVT